MTTLIDVLFHIMSNAALNVRSHVAMQYCDNIGYKAIATLTDNSMGYIGHLSKASRARIICCEVRNYVQLPIRKILKSH